MRLEALREVVVADNIPNATKTYREMLARWPDDLETLKTFQSI